MFFIFQRTYLYLVGESIEKLSKSNIVCVCVCVRAKHTGQGHATPRELSVFSFQVHYAKESVSFY